VLAGHPSKNIAADLGISQRTVESHRAAIMKRSGATSIPDLTRLAFSAGLPRLERSAWSPAPLPDRLQTTGLRTELPPAMMASIRAATAR
jgi:hypothetical protein